MTRCSYDVDADLTITALGEGWDDFARANAAPQLVSPAPLGRPLMSSIADAATGHVYRQLFERAAATGRPLSFPIRCDGPDLRRFLTLTISPRTTGGFRVSTVTTRTEPRDGMPLLAADQPRDDRFLTMCGWCQRVHLDGRWVELEEAATSLRLFDRAALPQVSHGICESCQQAMERLLEADEATG